jgi:hypothetical protein
MFAGVTSPFSEGHYLYHLHLSVVPHGTYIYRLHTMPDCDKCGQQRSCQSFLIASAKCQIDSEFLLVLTSFQVS